MLDHIQRYREDGNVFDMLCNNPDDMYYEVLRKRVSYFKKQEGGKKTMCEALEELITEAKNEGRKEGEDIGEKRGEERGEIKKLMKLLLKKFPNKNFEWVKECSKTQLERIDDYIFLNISYNDFYRLIHS